MEDQYGRPYVVSIERRISDDLEALGASIWWPILGKCSMHIDRDPMIYQNFLEMWTDLQNSFTDRFVSKFATKIG